MAMTALATGVIAGDGKPMTQETPDSTRPPLACSIEAQGDAAHVTLSGRVAGEAASGRYRLEVRKVGAAGNSTITQAGEFRVETAAPVAVGHVGLGLERDARYEAALTITTADRTYTCETFGPGPKPL